MAPHRNLGHIRLLRLQADGRDWELKLEPPVNSVLPIARDRLGALRAGRGVGRLSLRLTLTRSLVRPLKLFLFPAPTTVF